MAMISCLSYGLQNFLPPPSQSAMFESNVILFFVSTPMGSSRCSPKTLIVRSEQVGQKFRYSYYMCTCLQNSSEGCLSSCSGIHQAAAYYYYYYYFHFSFARWPYDRYRHSSLLVDQIYVAPVENLVPAYRPALNLGQIHNLQSDRNSLEST